MKCSDEIICSRQNRTIVEVVKLADRKHREALGLFRFDGIKLLEEALRNGISPVTVLLRAKDADRICREIEERCGVRVAEVAGNILRVEDGLFDRISEEKSPEGVICTAKYIDKLQKKITIYNSDDFSQLGDERIVLLESVRDPSNVGAILRSAAALGIDRLILSADCADIYHPRAVRASMGTLFNQRVDRVEQLSSAIAALQSAGRRVFAAALTEKAEVLGQFALRSGDCVVIGNEGHGLREETVALCDAAVRIPMSGRAESFNAAVAASVLMWEFTRTASVRSEIQ